MFQTTNQELSKTVKLGGNMFSDKPKKTCWCLRVVSPSTIFSHNINIIQYLQKKNKKKHHAHSWWKHINVPFIKNHHTSSNTIQYHQEYAHSWSHPHSWWKHGHRWFPNEQFATSTSNLPVFQGQITIKSLSVWIFDCFLSPFYPHGKLTCINHPHMLEKKNIIQLMG